MDSTRWRGTRQGTPRSPPFGSSQDRRAEKELARATADIDEAERRIVRQTALIDEFQTQGQPVKEPVQALARLEKDLIVRRDHQQELLARLSPAIAVDRSVASEASTPVQAAPAAIQR